MEPQERRVAVDEALTKVVSDFGRRISDDPVRLRNLLVDATGVNAMTLRDEIDAVVAAAETELPATVLQGDDTARLAAADRLTERLGDEKSDLAPWVTATWETVLAGTSSRPGAALAGPPGADATAVADDATAVADDATAVADDATIAAGDATVLPDGATVLPGGATVLAPEDAPAGGEGPDRRLLIGAVAGVFLLVLIIFLATRGGDDSPGPTDTADPDSGTSNSDDGSGGLGGDDGRDDVPDDSTMSGTTAISAADGVDASRTLSVGPSGTTATLRFTNTSDGVLRTRWVEVLSADMAAAGIDSGDEPVTVLTPEAFGFEFDLEPGETRSVAYQSSWAPADAEAFDELFDQYEEAEEIWFEENPDPRDPSLSTELEHDLVTESANLTVSGETDPWNELTVDGTSVTVDESGGYSTQVTLNNGENEIEIVAVSPLGVRTTRVRTVTFADPSATTTAPPTTAPPTTAPPTTAPPTTAPPTTAPPTTAPPTTAPPNRAPVNNCGNEYLVLSGYATSYFFGLLESCFSDADGDFVSIQANAGVGSPGSCGGGVACWIYYQPIDWDGTPYEVTVSIWGQDPSGAQSGSTLLTLCFNC